MKKIKKNNRRYQWMIFSLLMFLLIIIYIPVKRIFEYKGIGNKAISTDIDILANIEELELKQGSILLSGWVLRLNSQNQSIQIVLKNMEVSETIVFDADMFEYEEIEEYYTPNYDFGKCGFEAKVQSGKVRRDTCYEVLINLNYAEKIEDENGAKNLHNSKKISIGYYIYNEELYRYNPKEFFTPEIEDKMIQTVIRDGFLHSYDIEKQCWIYEYDSTLYIIVNFVLFSTLEQSPEIPIFLYTSRKEQLPEGKENNIVEYIPYYLTQEDYLKQGEEKYFVYSFKIPEKYVITYAQMGVYHNRGEHEGWIWKANVLIN